MAAGRRVWMGDRIENAIRASGSDRDKIVDYVYRCRCKDRHKHYYEIDEWAARWGAGNYTAEQAVAALNEMYVAYKTLVESGAFD